MRYYYWCAVGTQPCQGASNRTILRRSRLNGKSHQSGEERYGDYGAEPDLMTEAELNKLMQTARQEKLIELDQLRELAEILKWPTEREPVEGLY